MWALERNKDPLDLTEKEIRQYVALLRRRRYNENTIRRRITALRKLYAVATRQISAAASVIIPARDS
ncbi:site-specific integrase [Rhodococcus sp. NPDC059969]|uniref:site-specific integrase n=1 Tax=Rhodococcus sp. NPDC059969 TaxID=3347018 RepID=UPI00366DB565